jgi:hypothetical protein
VITPIDAALDLELLDHDFYLFTNAETGEDNVIARSEDGGYELREPATSSPATAPPSTTSSADSTISIGHSPIRPVEMDLRAAQDVLDLGDRPLRSDRARRQRSRLTSRLTSKQASKQVWCDRPARRVGSVRSRPGAPRHLDDHT